MLWSESPSGMCAKLHTVAASNNRDHPMRSLYYCLSVLHMYGCSSLRTFHSRWIVHSTQHQWRGCNNISFLQQTALIADSFWEGCIWHNLHIMVTAPFCCNRKARAVCVQSFTATIEITQHDHCIIQGSHTFLKNHFPYFFNTFSILH